MLFALLLLRFVITLVVRVVLVGVRSVSASFSAPPPPPPPPVNSFRQPPRAAMRMATAFLALPSLLRSDASAGESWMLGMIGSGSEVRCSYSSVAATSQNPGAPNSPN